jgi:glycogen debranching enzyme
MGFRGDGALTKQVQLLMGAMSLSAIIDPGAQSISMQLIPFVAMRDFHALRRGTDASFDVTSDQRRVSVRQGQHTLHLSCDQESWSPGADWWRGHYYAIDADRGQDHIEDLYQPGRFTFEITQPTTITLWASTDPIETINWDGELRKHTTAAGSMTVRRLTRAANDFIVARKNPDGSGLDRHRRPSLVADWGREITIALPGPFRPQAGSTRPATC